MEVPVSAQRMAQLEDFARRRGKTSRRDYEEAVAGVCRGLDDMKAGRTEAADAFLDEFARKHNWSRLFSRPPRRGGPTHDVTHR